MKSKILKFSKSLVKILLPVMFKILIKLKLNRRVINFLHEKSYNSNYKYDFTSLLEKFLGKNKIIALDVGAQGGFNSDNFFPKKYDHFFEKILIEPIDQRYLTQRYTEKALHFIEQHKQQPFFLYIAHRPIKLFYNIPIESTF